MASFQKYKTKSGEMWLFKTYIGIDPKTGKRKPTTRRGFKTKKDAQQAARILEDSVALGTYTNENITYEEAFNEWWSTHEKTIKPSTRYSKGTMFKSRIIPYFGKIKLKDISRAYCQQFIDDLAKEIKSVNDVKIQANLVFAHALRHGYIERNPMQFVSIPKQEEKVIIEEREKRNFWSRDELLHFLDLARKNMPEYFYIYFLILSYTGMRKGELIALEWKDIDFEAGTIRINKTMFFEDGKEIIQTAKKYASRRTIALDDETLMKLRKWKIRQREFFLAKGTTENLKHVITREDMRPIRLARPNEILNSFIKKHNLHPITVHGLRHTHASLLFEAEASLKEVQQRLGHKRLETTMDIYTHVTASVATKTAKTFSKFLKEN